MNSAEKSIEAANVDIISNGVSNISCSDQPSNDQKFQKNVSNNGRKCNKTIDEVKEGDSMQQNGGRSRIPRPEVSFSGFQQSDCDPSNASSGTKQKSSQKSGRGGKGKSKNKGFNNSKNSIPEYKIHERSDTTFSTSSLGNPPEEMENGTWTVGKDKSWTYTYSDTSNCPLHGTADSIHTFGTGSDPGPSTMSSYTSNPPVFVSGMMSEANCGSGKKVQTKNKKRKFNSYMSLTEIQKGLKKGEVLEGVLRINQRNYEDAYISSPQVDQPDIYIGGMHDRNRALHGDVVAVMLNSPERWKILEEAIYDYESKYGPLKFSNDQVDFDTNISHQSLPSSHSNHDLANNTRSPIVVAQNSFVVANESESNSSKPSAEAASCIAMQGDRHKLADAKDKTENMWDASYNAVPQPHTVEILGLESLQQQIDQYRSNAKKRNRKKRSRVKNDLSTSEELLPEEPETCNITKDDSCELGLVVSPEELLMNNMGKFISDVKMKTDSNTDDEYPSQTAVAPDKLSECEFSMGSDDNSICSDNLFKEEDKEFFKSQRNALNNNFPSENIDINTWRNSQNDWSVPISDNVTPELNNTLPDPVPDVGIIVSEKKNKRKRHRKRKGRKNEMDVSKENHREMNTSKQQFIPDNVNVKNRRMHYTVQQLLQHPNAKVFVQRTAEVLGIIERKHSRIAAGHLKLMQDKNPNSALFCPNDSRVPRIMVPMKECPSDFFERYKDYENVLYVVQIVKWDELSAFAFGTVIKNLGVRGDIEAETAAMLLENDVDFSEFPNEVLNALPGESWKIPDKELKNRKDFREECVFTIDPATARDLDDALSCSYLGDGLYRISVHIADVSYFISEGSMLDEIAKSRATSVYLVQKVVPMLPRVLCEKLCSLNPGEDRLTFSVEWNITEDGEIVSEWFGRGIINSCAKLSYDHAQDLLTRECDHKWGEGELPPVTGNYSHSVISAAVKSLNRIAKSLRGKRFESGALRLDQVKVNFTLDSDSGLPYGYSIYEQKDSHRLIEEYMLLANMAVAHFIYKTYPNEAFLRRHPEPQQHVMCKITEMCAVLGIIIDDQSSKGLQDSLSMFCGEDDYAKARYAVLSNLYSKPMNCAKYFCSGVVDVESYYHHYALNVPLYTHFTSPIRRYADIIVHRQLASALKIGPKVKLSHDQIQMQAEICNDKKYNAKRVSEVSSEMFLAMFVNKCGPIKEKAMVMGVMDHSIDVLLLNLGAIKRIYCDKLPLNSHTFTKNVGVPQLTLVWSDVSSNGHSNCKRNNLRQVLLIFCLVDVELLGTNDATKYMAILKRPDPMQVDGTL